jgi:hypothetical protein
MVAVMLIAGQFQGTGHIFPRDGLISALGMRHKSDEVMGNLDGFRTREPCSDLDTP